MKPYTLLNLAASAAIAAITLASVPASASFEGFGKDIPLDSAARQIVPDGWDVTYGDGVDPKTQVSWSSASDWQAALRAALSRKGYDAQFSDGKVTVVKASKPAAKPSAKAKPSAPRPYASSPTKGKAQRASVARKAAAPTVQEEPYRGGGGFTIRPYRGKASGSAESGGKMVGKGDFESYQPASPVFAVRQGQMLHPVLADWASAAGWGLVWDSEYDYRIDADASFSGDFIDAVTELAGAMSNARPAITVDFYKGNKVVVISNKSSDEAN